MDTIDTTHMRLKLNDPDLFRFKAFVGGDWVEADSGKTFEVTNPATGEVIGTVPDMGEAETLRAIDAADKAWPAWRKKTAKERAAILRKWNDLMLENAEDLARLMTLEQGKPLAEARGEVIVAPVDWAKLNTWRGGRPNPVFPTGERAAAPERPQTSGTAQASPSDAQDDILERLAVAAPARKRQVLDAFLEATVRKSFALPEGRKLDPKTPFGELGLDSLLAIELRNRLGRSLGLRLPATLLFENPTLATLGDVLMSEIALEAAPVPPESTRKTAPASDVFAGLDTLSDEELERMLGLEDTMNDEAEA